jgi:hypothetical protein
MHAMTVPQAGKVLLRVAQIALACSGAVAQPFETHGYVMVPAHFLPALSIAAILVSVLWAVGMCAVYLAGRLSAAEMVSVLGRALVIPDCAAVVVWVYVLVEGWLPANCIRSGVFGVAHYLGFVDPCVGIELASTCCWLLLFYFLARRLEGRQALAGPSGKFELVGFLVALVLPFGLRAIVTGLSRHS